MYFSLKSPSRWNTERETYLVFRCWCCVFFFFLQLSEELFLLHWRSIPNQILDLNVLNLLSNNLIMCFTKASDLLVVSELCILSSCSQHWGCCQPYVSAENWCHLFYRSHTSVQKNGLAPGWTSSAMWQEKQWRRREIIGRTPWVILHFIPANDGTVHQKRKMHSWCFLSLPLDIL